MRQSMAARVYRRQVLPLEFFGLNLAFVHRYWSIFQL